MLYFDRIDVSEGIDVEKKCIKRGWYLSLLVFLNFKLKFQPNFTNRCHDLLMMSVNLSDIAILNIEDSDYYCIISLINKSEAIDVLQNADFTEKIGSLKIQKNIKILKSYIKMEKSRNKNFSNIRYLFR